MSPHQPHLHPAGQTIQGGKSSKVGDFFYNLLVIALMGGVLWGMIVLLFTFSG